MHYHILFGCDWNTETTNYRLCDCRLLHIIIYIYFNAACRVTKLSRKLARIWYNEGKVIVLQILFFVLGLFWRGKLGWEVCDGVYFYLEFFSPNSHTIIYQNDELVRDQWQGFKEHTWAVPMSPTHCPRYLAVPGDIGAGCPWAAHRGRCHTGGQCSVSGYRLQRLWNTC